jgi:hypothetical protein
MATRCSSPKIPEGGWTGLLLLGSPSSIARLLQRRNAAGHWEIREFGPGQAAQLESHAIALPVDALYRDPLAR